MQVLYLSSIQLKQQKKLYIKYSPPYPPRRGAKKLKNGKNKSPSGGFRGHCGANWISVNYNNIKSIDFSNFI